MEEQGGPRRYAKEAESELEAAKREPKGAKRQPSGAKRVRSALMGESNSLKK